ncbi:MAG: endonuclease/exonuclease/phosphatase family protein [Bacteriovorax sp.]|nr:endonuclease/exonuclease/phosphatase family protein [Bacteriovorax sp.]
MKNFKTQILTFSSILLLALPAHGQSIPDIVFPVPTDNDVIHTLGHSSRTQLPSSRIKFLVWNLHKGANDTFDIEYPALAFDRDIIMNQEIFLDSNMTTVWRFLPQFIFTTATSFFDGKEKIRTGVANISTVAPTSSDFLRTQTLEPIIHSPKVLLISSYPIRGTDKKLTVVNIHGINFVSSKSFELELNRIYAKIKDIPSPLVFAGDFNTWNDERLNLLVQFSKKMNLSEAKYLPDHRMTFNGRPLDHFLYSADIKIISARVDGIYTGSDHKPLQVEIEYSPTTNNGDQSSQDY